jgi:hypothetical protein
MRLPRFTIAGLMGLVVVVVGAAALRFASELWAGVLLMLTLGVLGAAILAFHERTGSLRSWWRGFALFGWGYLFLAMGPWGSDAIAPHLPTTAGLDALYATMHPSGDNRVVRLRTVIDSFSSTGTTPPRTGSSVIELDVTGAPTSAQPPLVFRFPAANATPEPFRRVGHCLWALLVACLGGVVGRALHARGERASG